MFEASEFPVHSKSFTPQIYANFSLQNNRKERQKVTSILKNLAHIYEVKNEIPDFSRVGRLNFLRNLRKYSLVACPEGNGIDTHRLWETLYMGGIPVVRKNPAMQSLFDQLPVLQLNNWKELQNVGLIEKKYYEVQTKSWDPAILKTSYWISAISSRPRSVSK
jgi:hypothetical protein